MNTISDKVTCISWTLHEKDTFMIMTNMIMMIRKILVLLYTLFIAIEFKSGLHESLNITVLR